MKDRAAAFEVISFVYEKQPALLLSLIPRCSKIGVPSQDTDAWKLSNAIFSLTTGQSSL